MFDKVYTELEDKNIELAKYCKEIYAYLRSKKIKFSELVECMKTKYVELTMQNKIQDKYEPIKHYEKEVGRLKAERNKINKQRLPLEEKDEILLPVLENLKKASDKLSYFRAEQSSKDYWDDYFGINKNE